MAGEKIQETGDPEKVTVAKDILTTDANKQVIVCDLCGRVFLNWIPGGVDLYPIWWVDSVIEWQSGLCGGALVMMTRERAMQVAENYELIGCEEWMRGKRIP